MSKTADLPKELNVPDEAREGGMLDANDVVVDLKEEERREAILAKLPPIYQTKYREMLQMHDHPNPVDGGKVLTGKQQQELLDMNLVKRGVELLGGSAQFAGNILNGLEAVAEYIRTTYKYPCDKNSISQWMKKKRLPDTATEQFPLYSSVHGSNRHSKAEVDDWCKGNLPKPEEGGTASRKLDARQRKEEADARMAEREDTRQEREFSDRWIRYDAVKGYMGGAAQQISMHYDRLIEDKPGLRRLVVAAVSKIFTTTPEQLLALDAELAVVFPNAVDELKATFETIGEELQGRINELRKKEVKK